MILVQIEDKEYQSQRRALEEEAQALGETPLQVQALIVGDTDRALVMLFHKGYGSLAHHLNSIPLSNSDSCLLLRTYRVCISLFVFIPIHIPGTVCITEVLRNVGVSRLAHLMAYNLRGNIQVLPHPSPARARICFFSTLQSCADVLFSSSRLLSAGAPQRPGQQHRQAGHGGGGGGARGARDSLVPGRGLRRRTHQVGAHPHRVLHDCSHHRGGGSAGG